MTKTLAQCPTCGGSGTIKTVALPQPGTFVETQPAEGPPPHRLERGFCYRCAGTGYIECDA